MRMDFSEQIEEVFRSYRKTRERLTEAQTRVREAYGTARSRDNLVACSVGPGGEITELTISPRAMERYDAARLATTIQEVITEANAQLRTYVVEQYREVLGDSFNPEAIADPSAAMETIQQVKDRLRGP